VESFHEAKAKAADLSKKTHLPVEQIQIFIDRNGPEAFDIIEEYFRPGLTSVWQLEAYFAIHHGMCGTLLDFYLRRAPLFLSEKDHGYSLLDSISHIFKEELNWSEDQRKSNIQNLLKHEEFELSWKKYL
jgi:glycerol-3-phosphate dehydrogenase